MIAELFYPKELKDAIVDLRAKDDLNEAALRHVNMMIFMVLWVAVLALGLLLAIEGVGGVFICALLFSPVGIYFAAKENISERFYPYLFGVKKKIRLNKGKASGKIGNFIYGLVFYDADLKLQVRTPLLKEISSIEVPEGIEGVYCFIHPSSPVKGMPNMVEVMRHYCLSKSMLNEGV